MLESIFLDFWKDKFIVHILCFISLLIICLGVEVIKRLLWPLKELVAPFKNRKNGLQLTSLIAPTILKLEKSLENKIFRSNIKLKI